MYTLCLASDPWAHVLPIGLGIFSNTHSSPLQERAREWKLKDAYAPVLLLSTGTLNARPRIATADTGTCACVAGVTTPSSIIFM